MTETCDTCQSSDLEAVYEPEGGSRGLKIYLCNGCGLLQSLPRIENANLPAAHFDIVHSCHTIEHLGHALCVLQDHHRILKPGGLMVMDAPNVDLIGGPDILEEWFIDKHLYHYSSGTLAAVIKA